MDWFQQAIAVLNQKKIILTPSDTIWGLSGNALESEAARKIHDIKQRPTNKSFIVLVSDIKMLEEFVEFPKQVQLFLNATDRPTTVIYPKSRHLPKEILAGDGSIGIRISAQEWLSDFINQFGKPIISTSANISGESTAFQFSDISTQIKENVDYTVPFLQYNNPVNKSSQIIKFDENGEIIKIRG